MTHESMKMSGVMVTACAHGNGNGVSTSFLHHGTFSYHGGLDHNSHHSRTGCAATYNDGLDHKSSPAVRPRKAGQHGAHRHCS